MFNLNSFTYDFSLDTVRSWMYFGKGFQIFAKYKIHFFAIACSTYVVAKKEGDGVGDVPLAYFKSTDLDRASGGKSR